MKLLGPRLSSIALVLILSACAGERNHREGLNLLAEGKPAEGVSRLEKAAQEAPDKLSFRADFLHHRDQQVNRLLSGADADRAAGKWNGAEQLYKMALAVEPGNSRAAAGLALLARERAHEPMLEAARDAYKKGELERALVLLQPVFAENPRNPDGAALRRQIEAQQTKNRTVEPLLQFASKKPINLEFRDANLKVVFEALARTSGVSFILDKDVRPDLRTTVFLRQSSLEDAIDLLLQTNRLEKKVLNRNTILIYPNTPDKLKEYQELVMKGFYLANADVKQTQAMLKALLKTKDMYIDEKLNLLVMRDTPDAIRLAEKVIAMHDLNEPEVMLDVEVLEIKRSRLLEMGIQWPNQLSLTPLTAASTLGDLKRLNSDAIGANLGSAIVKLRREVGDGNILANPRIRARNREKAKIMIGDKVPASTQTTTATGVIAESVQYLDVGIKLEVEPTVYLEDEVAIKIGLEVSAITSEVRTPGGSLAYQIGSRSASTVLRLKDGETQVLAGLINNEDRMASSRVPGLGDLPIIGRLFSTQKDDRNKTEIILSITPRLIRNINRPDASASEFWSGTESTLRTQPLTLQLPPVVGDGGANGAGALVPSAATGPAAGGAAVEAKTDTDPTAISLGLKGPATVKAGEQFRVVLRMTADGGVRSLPFQLGYDSAAFQVLGVTEGNFFKQNEGQTSLSSNVDATMGKVFATALRTGADGARGDDSVAIVTLRALAAKPHAEIRVLTAAPLTVGGKTMVPAPSAPLTISVVE